MAQMRSQTENVAVNRHVFASMAQELGIQFEFITNRDHDVLQNMDIRDPDVAYLFEPSTTKIRMRVNDGFSTCDANFLWKGESHEIIWESCTKAWIRKLLEDSKKECCVCLESPHWQCLCECSSRMCAMCSLKIGLTPQNIQRFQSGDFEMTFQCPECRVMMGGDVRDLYYKVLDRIEEFPQEQQDILMILKALDPVYERASADSKRAQQNLKQLRLKQFRTECKIQIVGLEDSDSIHLNGKKGVIVGDKVMQNGAIRWPVILQDGSNERTMLRQLNMRKTEFSFWKMPELVFRRKKVVADPDEPDLDNLWDDDSD